MLRTLFVLVIGLVSTCETTTAQVVDPLDVIEKAIAVHGGKENLAKYPARTITSKGSVSVGVVKFKYTATQYFHYPNKYRVEGKITTGDETLVIVQVVNGKEGWQKMGENATAKIDAHALQAVQTQIQVDVASILVPLLDSKQYTVSSIGELEVNRKKTIGLNVKNKTGLDVNIYFDPKTHLMVKQEFGTKNFFTVEDVLQETYLSKHKKANGIMMPMQSDIHYNGKQASTMTAESLQFNEQLDASLFVKPE